MKLPIDAIIAQAKIRGYLLKWLPENDKSLFLGQAGYIISAPERLELDLREQILPLEASYVGSSSFGDRYEIRGELTGPNGKSLAVVTIWMTEYETGQTKFITLFPDKES
ncbi:MAG: hypothetical protein VKN60_07570 [Cyanobacteriota bacterium]|nr:hypothetical protein [Cyanobacteriota bacterium]